MQQSNPSLVADALVEARRSHRPADALALAASLLTPADAYRAQALVARHMEGEAPAFPAHWKSGGPSRTAQATHAPLPRAGVWASPADARAWPFNLRLIEVEIALRLGRAVSPADAEALTHEAAVALVDAMTVSIEVVDSRWQQGVEAPGLLKLADLQSHGALVLGDWLPFPFSPRDWSAQACTVTIGSAAPAQFRGTHSMADPAWVLPAWLRHATRDGATVPAGTVVTTGTWCGMLPAAYGDLVTARFDGVGEAVVQL
jgi:2-keto-4-pentenoate hydratase